MTTFGDNVYSNGGVLLGPAVGSAGIFGNTWFVDNSQSASGDGTGIGNKAVLTIAEAVTLASAGDTIYVRGTGTDYDESVTLSKARVSLIGTGGWMQCGWNADADATCLKITAVGCRVSGFLFRPDGATTGIAINISEVTADDVDGTVIDNNIFKSTGTTAAYAIFANGCPAYVKVYNNHFTWINTGIGATSAPNTSATGWEVVDNYFSRECVNGIYMPFRRTVIKGNAFECTTIAVDTVGYSATNGDYNNVYMNQLSGTYATTCEAQTNDSWAGNWNELSGGVTAANPG